MVACVPFLSTYNKTHFLSPPTLMIYSFDPWWLESTTLQVCPQDQLHLTNSGSLTWRPVTNCDTPLSLTMQWFAVEDGGAGKGGSDMFFTNTLSSFQNQPKCGHCFTNLLSVCVCWYKSDGKRSILGPAPKKWLHFLHPLLHLPVGHVAASRWPPPHVPLSYLCLPACLCR